MIIQVSNRGADYNSGNDSINDTILAVMSVIALMDATESKW